MLINTLTNDDKYPLGNCVKLPLPISNALLTKNEKPFLNCLLHFQNRHQILNILKKKMIVISSIYKWGARLKPQHKRTKFLNLLALVHLKNYFIEALNKFLRCFEINGLKNLKLTILRFLHGSLIYIYYLNSSKNFFIVKTP